MPARSRCVRFGIVLLVVALAAAGTAVASGPATVDRPATVDHANESLPTVTSQITVDVAADGDARWTERLTVHFDNQTTSADFSEIASEFEGEESRLLPIERYRNASDGVAAAAGREMEITDTERRTEMTADNGTLILSFTWTNFGERQGSDLSVRDVFAGDTGRWFPGLESFQTLTIRGPDDHEIISASQGFQNQTLRWSGPVTFGPNSPYVVYSRSTNPPPDTATTDAPTTPGTSGTGGDGGLVVGVLIALLLGAIAVVAYGASQRDGDLLPSPSDDPVETEEAVETDEASGVDEAAAGGTGAAATAEAEATDDDDVDEALLSDEERVERLLEDNGGRMKQANIVSETGWSNAKVSQLLSSMAEEGRIEKLRIGRENLISFPDEDIVDDEE
ncbi:hypothetical protein GJ629_13205 [Halapricum sp. CBA1109]|uniref:helix-turn-helix transcriptional regulator n=1 Tax=Halapricum sp. CBA1109 TaxID=2668068 RepID=UPI0012FBB138|nr:hypothetical protein [Halapricum sp. CBA1109]MUV90740.1 hypothetical protein [Halapricum sp. CBA1109]